MRAFCYHFYTRHILLRLLHTACCISPRRFIQPFHGRRATQPGPVKIVPMPMDLMEPFRLPKNILIIIFYKNLRVLWTLA